MSLSAHEAVLLRHPELVAQVEADLADPSQAVPSAARRPRTEQSSASSL